MDDACFRAPFGRGYSNQDCALFALSYTYTVDLCPEVADASFHRVDQVEEVGWDVQVVDAVWALFDVDVGGILLPDDGAKLATSEEIVDQQMLNNAICNCECAVVLLSRFGVRCICAHGFIKRAHHW
eukprot:3010883-Rhodomonas_salina.1